MVRDTSASKDVSIQQIWDSHLKYYKRYVLDTIILQTRSEVKFKVTQKWYVTLHHPKLHQPTKLGIPTFNNKRYALDMIFLKTRPEVKVTVTCKWYKTLHHPKMHSHTKFGIPISNNKRDMLLTQLLLKRGQGHSDP